MANDAKKTSDLGITTAAAQTDRLVILTNPSTTPALQTIQVLNVANTIASAIPAASGSTAGVVKVGTNMSISNGYISATGVAAPANSNSTGTTGQIAWDTQYIYVCTATNTWKRVALNLTAW